MKKTWIIGLSAIAAVLVPTLSMGESLPKNAAPLSESEARALYAGKSSNWSKSRAYFAPDGTYFVYGKDKAWFAEGKWTVSGNKVCGTTTWTDIKDGKTGKGGSCWTWYRSGKRHLMLWSGDKDPQNGYYDGELKKLSVGDKVTKTVLELKKKIKA